jgi:hypothetical protein
VCFLVPYEGTHEKTTSKLACIYILPLSAVANESSVRLLANLRLICFNIQRQYIFKSPSPAHYFERWVAQLVSSSDLKPFGRVMKNDFKS